MVFIVAALRVVGSFGLAAMVSCGAVALRVNARRGVLKSSGGALLMGQSLLGTVGRGMVVVVGFTG